MSITPELIQFIIYAIIITSIIIFLIKKVISIAICLVVVLIIFNIGFRYDGEDMMNKLNLNEFLEPETSQQVSDFFDDFASKREELGIIDADKVYDKMTGSIETGYYIMVDGIGKIDINKFAKNLAKSIYESGMNDIDFNELATEIQKQFKISEEEATSIAQKVQIEHSNISE